MFPECRFLQIETFEVQFIARWEHHLVKTEMGVIETLNPVWSERRGLPAAPTELFILILYLGGVH